jgi:hypothetical protein
MSALKFLHADPDTDPDDVEREEYLLPEDKLIRGNPRQVVWNAWRSSNRPGRST